MMSDDLLYAFGHDEYMYRMLVANDCRIPREGLAMVRLHSCYPWHTGGAYRIFMSDDQGDDNLLQSVKEFNKFDLYTKDEHGGANINVDELWPYYQKLIEKYFPNPDELKW